MDTNPADWLHNAITLWLIAGVALMALEALGISGVGLMFAGLASLGVGFLIHLNLLAPDAYISQFIALFGLTAIWTALLWKPMQKLRLGKHKGGYNNIVGDTAYVVSSGLDKRNGGEVTWSGTIMKAQLIPDAAVDSLEAGAQVIIVSLTGATLIVKPKA